jgi:hypothetical protein
MMVGVDEAGKIDYRTTIRDTTVLPGSCSKKALGNCIFSTVKAKRLAKTERQRRLRNSRTTDRAFKM